jgi:hypothetical protein
MRMKAIAICAGLLFALAAGAQDHAQDPLRAKLIGRRVVSTYPGTPILVCRYAGPDAKYEVVSSDANCARYLKLN